MNQRKIPAVFYRGGTSRAIFFHSRDLPDDQGMRDAIFLRALGSPDPNGRQLDGLGGGVSSLSKIGVIGPSSRPDADVNFTFGQVSVETCLVDYSGNCGNMSSAVGPFAVEEGLVPTPTDGEATVRIHNTNTSKIIISRFQVEDGTAAVDGDYEIPGVPGTGSPIALDFVNPGGAGTGRLLPTGRPMEEIEIEGIGAFAASLVDATNPAVFIRAKDLGLRGSEGPGAIDARNDVMVTLEQIRAEAGVRMEIASNPRAVSEHFPSIPKVAIVAPPSEYMDLKGSVVYAKDCDVISRVISMGKTHRAFALTGAMCLAVAARLPGTIVHEITGAGGGDLRLGHPSGVQHIGAVVAQSDGCYRAEKVTVYRTARRLMEGAVCVPETAILETSLSG